MTTDVRKPRADAAQHQAWITDNLALTSVADRRRACLVVLFGIISATSSALLVWSIAPFLELLIDPDAIDGNRFLPLVSVTLGITDPYLMFLGMGAVCLFLILSVFVAQLMSVRALSNFSASMVHELSTRLLSAYLQQPYEFFLDRHRSDLNTNILSETEAVVGQFFRPMLQLVVALIATFAIIAVLASVNATAMLFMGGGILLVYGIVYLVIRRRIRRLGEQRAEANRRRFREAGDGLQSIKDVKVLGLEDPYLARFEVSSQVLRSATVHSQIFSSVPGFALRAVLMGGGVVFLLLYIEKDTFIQGIALDGIAPALGALVVAAQRLLPEIQRVLESVLRLQYGRAASEQLRGDL